MRFGRIGFGLALVAVLSWAGMANSTTTAWDIGPGMPSGCNAGPYGRSIYSGTELRLKFTFTADRVERGSMTIQLYGGVRRVKITPDQFIDAKGDDADWAITKADGEREFWYTINCWGNYSKTDNATMTRN